MNWIRGNERRKFYLIISLFLLVVTGFKIYRESYGLAMTSFLIITSLFSLEFFMPSLSERLFKLWLRFAKLLGHINTTILLTLVYAFCLVPIALLARVFAGESPYSTAQCRKRRSSWFPIAPDERPDRYTTPY